MLEASLLYSDEYFRAPEPVWARLRDDHPVFWDEVGQLWWLSRYDDVAAVFADHETYSAATYEASTGAVLGPTLISRDDHGHVQRRSIVAPAFVGKRLAQVNDLIVACANALIGRFADAGSFDLVGQFSTRLPVDVITAMLGVGASPGRGGDDPEGDLFRRWVSDIIVGLAPAPELRQRGLAAKEAFCAHLAPALEGIDDPQRTDLIAKIARAEVDGFRLPPEEITAFCGLLFIAGGETTDKAIGLLWWNLLRHPDQFAAVRADPQLWHAAFSETMRRTPPVITEDRFTRAPVSWYGTEIPMGARVRVCIGSAHLDETRFADPLRFSIDRADLHLAKELRSGGSTEPDRHGHLGFGLGKHFCIGYELARTEAIVGSQLLVERLGPLGLDPSAAAITPRVVTRSFQAVPRLPLVFDRLPATL